MKIMWVDVRFRARALDSIGAQSDGIWRIVIGSDEWGRESTIYAYPSRATANRSYSHLRQCIALTEGGVYSSDKRWDKK